MREKRHLLSLNTFYLGQVLFLCACAYSPGNSVSKLQKAAMLLLATINVQVTIGLNWGVGGFVYI